MKKFIGVFICFISFQNVIFGQNNWSDSLILTPERTSFQRTSTYHDVILFLDKIERSSRNVNVFSIGQSLEGREIPVAILSAPPVKTPEEAKASGKLVIYLQGNIHAGEVEGKESIMMLMRDILLGNKKYLLENLIIILAPMYNTDANDKMAKGLRPSQEDSPLETGERANSQGYDLNRDGMKMEALETRALFQNIILAYDPQVFVDLHTSNGTWHAYPLTWAPSYHSIGEFAPYDYCYNKMLPSITQSVKEKYDLHFGHYGDYNLEEGWPPENFYTYSHRPRYLVNQFGLRNRMAILSEAFAHNRFYERINSTHTFITEILEYSNTHASEILETNKKAEESSIRNVLINSGKIKKGVQFQMGPLHKINDFITYDHILGTDSQGKKTYYRTGKIVKYNEVNYHAKFTPTLESTLPRSYIIPAEFEQVIQNLKMQGIRLDRLSKDRSFNGESFLVDSIVHEKESFQNHKTSTLYGNFVQEKLKFKKGDYMVDLAQPLANLVFYLLEPQSDDGLAHWNYFDKSLKKQAPGGTRSRYPVFKFYGQ